MNPNDVAAYIRGALALVPATITAGAGNDGVAVNGPEIDRLANYHQARSAALLIAFQAVLGAGETLSLKAVMRDAAALGGTYANYTYRAATDAGENELVPDVAKIVATGPAGGGTVRGVAILPVDLRMARRAIRAQVTADLSRANTDTVALSGTLVLGGFDTLPQG